MLQRRAGFMPEKITRQHQERLAIIYIRQSTPQQVERNQESTKLQYALVDRAFQFGWARETIVTIDDDLGRSGSSIEGRLGFQRLVAEVGLGHVGLVLGIEMSRLEETPDHGRGSPAASGRPHAREDHAKASATAGDRLHPTIDASAG